MELINGSWQQTIAYLLEQYISKVGDNQITPELLEQLKNQIIEELKKKPQVDLQIVTKYINTETTRWVYVSKPEDVKPPKIQTSILNYNPTDGFKPLEGSNIWLVKEDNFGRKYFRNKNSKKVLSHNEWSSLNVKVNNNHTHHARMSNSNVF